MSSIDHQRYRAVQTLEKLGWKFVDNNWVAPIKTTELPVVITPNIKYEQALKEIIVFFGKRPGIATQSNSITYMEIISICHKYDVHL